MDIIYLGQSSFSLKGKNATLVTDPYHSEYGLKFPKASADIVTVSHEHSDHNASEVVSGEPFLVNAPGEYEIKGVKMVGVDSFHDDKSGKERGKNTIFSIKMDGIIICHLGDFGQKSLTSEQQELIGNVDILLLPTGGNYTIDSETAGQVASSVEPKIIIPMHYLVGQTDLKIDPVDKFLKEEGVENTKQESKLTITREKLPAEQQVIVLEIKA